MKKIAVVLFLGAILLSANASSILEHLYNSTKLRGGVKYSTDNGLKIGYDGKLVFDNGLLGFEIANMGGSFNAIPKGGRLGNTTNGTVDYSGDIHVGTHGHHADIGVNGTAGLYAEWNAEKGEHGGGHVDYNASLTNHAQWTASSDNHSAEGTTGSILNVTGGGCDDGEGHIVTGQKFKGAHATRGTVSHDHNGNDSNFSTVQFVRGGVVKEIFVHHDNHSNIAGHLFPQVAYKGKGGLQRASYAEVDGHKAGHVAEGAGKFGGLIWVDHDHDNDTWTTSIKHAKSADFIHKGKFLDGHHTKAKYKGIGTIAALDGAEIHGTKDGKDLKVGILKTGELHHAGVVKVKPCKEDEEKLEKLLEEMEKRKAFLGMDNFEEVRDDLGDDNHHKKKIKTFVHAKWAAGKGVHATHNDDGTVDVDTHGGAVWSATGADSKHKKPWHHKGGFGYNSTFEIDPSQGKISDIKVEFGNDTSVVDEFKQKFQLDALHLNNLI